MILIYIDILVNVYEMCAISALYLNLAQSRNLKIKPIIRLVGFISIVIQALWQIV